MQETPETERREDAPSDADGAEEPPRILEEIEIEELAIDGICGVY